MKFKSTISKALALILVMTNMCYVFANVKGDVDGDGYVTANDASLALESANGLFTLTPEQFDAAKVTNQDKDKITISDIAELMKKALDTLHSFPNTDDEPTTEDSTQATTEDSTQATTDEPIETTTIAENNDYSGPIAPGVVAEKVAVVNCDKVETNGPSFTQYFEASNTSGSALHITIADTAEKGKATIKVYASETSNEYTLANSASNTFRANMDLTFDPVLIASYDDLSDDNYKLTPNMDRIKIYTVVIEYAGSDTTTEVTTDDSSDTTAEVTTSDSSDTTSEVTTSDSSDTTSEVTTSDSSDTTSEVTTDDSSDATTEATTDKVWDFSDNSQYPDTTYSVDTDGLSDVDLGNGLTATLSKSAGAITVSNSTLNLPMNSGSAVNGYANKLSFKASDGATIKITAKRATGEDIKTRIQLLDGTGNTLKEFVSYDDDTTLRTDEYTFNTSNQTETIGLISQHGAVDISKIEVVYPAAPTVPVKLSDFGVTGFGKDTTGGNINASKNVSANEEIVVTTPDEFANALKQAKTNTSSNKGTIIKITANLDMGRTTAEGKHSSGMWQAHDNQPLVSDALKASGIGRININGIKNLTIYSPNKNEIQNAGIVMSNCDNIIIRNVVFPGVWEWDEGKEYLVPISALYTDSSHTTPANASNLTIGADAYVANSSDIIGYKGSKKAVIKRGELFYDENSNIVDSSAATHVKVYIKGETEPGAYDINDWDIITMQENSKIPATNVWIDHCVFSRAYDGMLDAKQGSNNITVSWNIFDSGSPVVDDGMRELEDKYSVASTQQQKDEFADKYPMYYYLRTTGGLTADEIYDVASLQKKASLIGAGDDEPGIENLSLTFSNNVYLNIQDRMPRLRGGYIHVYNTFIDNTQLLDIKTTLESKKLKLPNGMHFGVTNQGILSNMGGLTLVENTLISDVTRPFIYQQSNGEGTPSGALGTTDGTGSILGKNVHLTLSTKNIDFHGNTTDADFPTQLAPYGNGGNGATMPAFDQSKWDAKATYSYTLFDAENSDTFIKILQYGMGIDSNVDSFDWTATSYTD